MKRMLEWKDVLGNRSMCINASSIDIIMTCPRKAEYALSRDLRGSDESEALVFGTAIHSALEAFYRAAPGSRKIEDLHQAFDAAAEGKLLAESNEKRSIENGHKILSKYFEVYANDPWVIYTDNQGPFVERSFELEFSVAKYNDLPFSVYVHGQIDAILQNTETGELVVCDHKTTSTVSDLMNRVNPNLQFSLYAWAANELGIKTDRVMVNAIQVAKTKCDLLRVFTSRGEDDWSELRSTVHAAARTYHEAQAKKSWPMNTSSCSNYGGCQYLEICSTAKGQRENMIRSKYDPFF